MTEPLPLEGLDICPTQPKTRRPAKPSPVVEPRVKTWNHRATNQEIVQAYQETGSVWRAGAKLGMTGQSVHEKLRVLGYQLASSNWTDTEDAELRRLINSGVPLGQISHTLGRPYAGVACRASRLGIKSANRRQRKVPRGAGYDKQSAKRHLRALAQSGVKVTAYARAEGMSVDLLVQSMQRHFPKDWQRYLATHSALPQKTCTYCATVFIPMNGKQVHCTRDCATKSRVDRSYFGGQRRSTIGLAEGVCQLCERVDVKGLSSHHVIGKENDEDNAALVALCRGCHQIVTWLGARAFVDNPRAWESLISLAWMRRHGPEMAGWPEGGMLYTEVIIEKWDDSEGEDETPWLSSAR